MGPKPNQKIKKGAPSIDFSFWEIVLYLGVKIGKYDTLNGEFGGALCEKTDPEDWQLTSFMLCRRNL